MLKKTFLILLIMLCIPLSCFAADLKIVMTDPAPEVDKITFMDENMSIAFSLNEKNGVTFTLKNLTNKMIKLDWNQVSFIDFDQKAHKVIHTGIVFANRNDPQAPSIVPPIPNTKITDTMFPLDNIAYESNIWTGSAWVTHNFLTKNDVNKSFSVFLPLDIGGTVKYYSFTFKVIKEES